MRGEGGMGRGAVLVAAGEGDDDGRDVDVSFGDEMMRDRVID